MTKYSTINPKTGNVIWEHIFEFQNGHRKSYINESKTDHPDNTDDCKYVYTAFAYPTRAQTYIKKGSEYLWI